MSHEVITFWNTYIQLYFMQLEFTNSEFLQVDFVLEEISYLQVEGPSEEDVLTILEIEQRAHENGLQV